MMFDKLLTNSSVLEASMKATEFKSQTLLNNIANVDTPGFKAKNIEFEGMLKEAMDSYEITGEFDVNSVVATITSPHRNFKYRKDSNNVDIETELMGFYKNSVKYDVVSNSVLSNKTRLNTVLTAIK